LTVSLEVPKVVKGDFE